MTLIDFLFWMILVIVIIGLSIPVTRYINRSIELQTLENYMYKVFNGMESYYWQNRIDSGCVSPPTSVTLSDLSSDGYIDLDDIDYGSFSSTSAELSYETTSDGIFPTNMIVTVSVDSSLINNYGEATYLRTLDMSNNQVVFEKPFNEKSFDYGFIETLDSNGCVDN